MTARDLARLKKEQQKSNARAKKKGGQRQIHLLFEEMKARQQGHDHFRDEHHCSSKSLISDQRNAYHGNRHSTDDGIGGKHHNHSSILDSSTTTSGSSSKPTGSDYNASTNLYVGNLPLNICESELHEIFGKYGIIGSVKIMWPRTEEEHARDRLCGFVSYIRRCDAELALNQLKDNHLFGERLRLGWGKPVSNKSNKNKQSDTTTTENMLSSSLPGDNTQKKDEDGDVNLMEYQVPPSAIRYVIKKPGDEILKAVIDRTAYYVAQFGQDFEKEIVDKESDNDKFKLFILDNGEWNKYYRWRVYSLSMGDSLYQWRRTPFQIIQNGPYWIPPVMDTKTDLNQQIENDIYFLRNNNNNNNKNGNNYNNNKRKKGSNNNNTRNERGRKNFKEDDGGKLGAGGGRDGNGIANNYGGGVPFGPRTRLTSRPLLDRDRTKFMAMLRFVSFLFFVLDTIW